MKRQTGIIGAAAAVLITASAGMAGHGTSIQVGIEARYEALSPHGTWIDHEEYGNVWQPHEVHRHAGWQPYQNGGCWVRSSAGVRWRSYYPWGQITFGFGRWVQGGHCGWIWVPGPACHTPRVSTQVYGGSYHYRPPVYRARRCAPPPRVHHYRAPAHHRPPARGHHSSYAAPRHAAPRHAPAAAPRVSHAKPRASSRSSELHALVRGRFGR